MSPLRLRSAILGLLSAVALAACCGASIALADAPDPAIQQFVGTYTYVGGDAEIRALDRAIDEEVGVFFENGQIRIHRPGQPEVSAPADGRTITWRHPTDGDVFQVSHGVDEEGVLYQRFEGERSVSRNRFVLGKDKKRLTIHTVITADRLPAPLRFKMTYARVAAQR